MGKRELLIISLFVAAGVITYRMTAAPASPQTTRLTWRGFLESFRGDARRNRATVASSSQGTITLTDTITEVRISGISGLTVRGSARGDIQFDMKVDVTAPDEATARQAVSRARLIEDRVGSVLALRLDQIRGSRATVRLTLLVPDRLAIRADAGPGTGQLDVSDVDSVRLESVVGDVTIARVAHDVSGIHRNGDLAATDVGSAHLSLVSSKAVFENVRGDATVTARNGQLGVRGGGAIELDLTNQRTTLDAPNGEVHVLGSGGALQLRSPAAPVTIDVRRMAVDITLSRGVPIAVLTSDAPAHLGLIGAPPITLDVSASEGGRIRVMNLPGTPETTDAETRLHHSIGVGGATVALRNQRADIVIDAVK